MIRHSVPLTRSLLTCAVALMSMVAGPVVAAGAPTDAAAPRVASTSRAPLAMLAGDVPWPDAAVTARDGSLQRLPDVRPHDRPEFLPRVPPDEFLASLMDSVRLTNVTGTIQRLQDFYTRYVVTDSCWASAEWITRELESYGYSDVVYDTFRCWSYQDTVDAANVIAVKPGTTRPDEYVVIGGHYDSISVENFHDPDAYAPGADDNGTGVAGVLEAARILAPLELERSVIFAIWSGEEVGLRGSRAWVADAVADAMDIVIYLNMDVIGYTDEPEPVAIVYCDTTSLAVAGLVQDLIIANTPYDCITTVQPVGASDQNSFSERGINILDTSSGAGWSPYHHTEFDIIDNVDLELCRALAASNVAATAALALVVGEEPNIPPETLLADNCAATHDTLSPTPRFEWSSVDFDGEIAGYEYRVASPDDAPPGPRTWIALPPDSTGVTLAPLDDGPHEFEVRAIDDEGLADPTQATRGFTVSGGLAPRLTVAPRFGPHPMVFVGAERSRRDAPGGERGDARATLHGTRADSRDPVLTVFENERLVFDVFASADHYCSTIDSVLWARGRCGAAEWTTPADRTALENRNWQEIGHGVDARDRVESRDRFEVLVRPGLGDTALTFRAVDSNGGVTLGTVGLDVIPAGMTLPLLHIDDWFAQSMPEEEHDALYDSLLAGRPHDTWDPYEHIQGSEPQLPSMEDLGEYRTVLWSLGGYATALRPAHAESGYHAIEGFVRAGGNLILEGYSTLSAFASLDALTQNATFEAGDFLYDHAGIDSLHNAGNLSNPGIPAIHGYAFLGATSLDPTHLPDVPVDTLGSWSEGFVQYGGLPWCEVYRTAGAARTHLFDAYINESLAEKPCATFMRSDVGCGSVAVLGFPMCYLQQRPARELAHGLLDGIHAWQEPADLAFVTWDADREYVFLLWYLLPVDGPQGARLERRVSGEGDFEPICADLVMPDDDGRYRYIDANVEPGAVYDYRLVVTESWGGTTFHGPWTIEIPVHPSGDRLGRPFPNPTRGAATFSYSLADEHRWARIGVYSAGGRLVRRLESGPVRRGTHEGTWDGLDESGAEVASGVYFIRADFGGPALERKLVIIR